MKKRFLTLFLILVATISGALSIFASCGVQFNINFMVEGEVYATVITGGNEIIAMPQNPTKADHNFDGWYWDEGSWQTPFTANSLLDAPLSSDMRVYAKFSKIHHHEYSHTTTAPTCTEKGKTVYVCECGDEYFEEIPATGVHTWDNGKITTAPTCTENGVKTFTCTVCKTATYTEEVPALTHDKTTHSARAPTCTQIGWEEYQTCQREGCDYSTYKEIPATGVHTWDNGKQTTAPTCTNNGVKTFTCTVCLAATKTEPIDKLPHDHSEKWTSNTTYHWHECSSCGDKKDEAKHTAGAPATATTPQTCTVCGYILQEETGILFNTLTVDGTKVYGKVSNITTEFSFITEVTVKGNATYVVDNDKDCGSPIYSKTVDLKIGDNTFYVLEMVGNDVKLYTVTIRRRPMYEVTFNANGGTSVAKQVVEEDSFAVEPKTERVGYTFTGWDYDFESPIISDTQITATWQAHSDTPYKVEYYLQNLENDDYTLDHTDSLSGTTDTTATAEIKTFAHFTYNASKSVVSGNIDCDGSKILSVYYTRNVYTLSVSNSSAGSITNAGNYTYGTEEVVSTVTPPNLGYDFLGWYSGEVLLTSDLTYTFTATQDVTAKFAVKAEMANFNFTSTLTACSITGIKDKSVTQIIVPDFVTSIGDSAFYGCSSWTSIVIPDSVTSIGNSAFYGCSNLKEITLPFVGETKGGTSNAHFGYIFGASSYSSNNSYVPTSLKKVTITGGNIGNYAFEDCGSLTSVVIGDSVTSIGFSAFYSCSSLTSVYITDIAAWCNISFESSFANPLYYAGNLYLNNELVTDLVIPDGVTSIGSLAFYNCDSLASVVIGDSVTSIGYSAFAYCSKMTSVVIGDSVISIGEDAFYNCISLTSVVIPDSVTSISEGAFYGCSSLTSVEIPDSVTNIGSKAFRYCSSLTSVVIPDSVTSIGDSAFRDCSSLTEITLPFIGASKYGSSNSHFGYIFGASSYSYNSDYVPTSLKKVTITCGNIGSYAFYKCSSLTSVVIPDSVTSIGDFAFYNCSKMTSVVIGDSVTSIGFRAFDGCSSLTSVVIGDSVTSIGNQAFYNCSKMTSVVIGDSVTSIGAGAFRDCRGLTSIVIPDNVTSIGDAAFYGCNSLTSVVIGDSVTSIGYEAFYNCSSLTSVVIGDSVTSIGNNAFYGCISLTSVVIPDSVTSIGSSAFDGCSKMTSVVIGDSVTSIGDYAFEYCSSLTKVYITDIAAWCKISFANSSANPLCYAKNLYLNNELITDLVIPDSVTSIGSYAFYKCSSLTSVVIPDSVTSIGDYAFLNCSSLTSVVIGDSVTSIGEKAFYYCSSLTSVVIPDSVTSIGDYAFYGCSNLKEIILPFVGESKGGTSNTHFGYIFGASSYSYNEDYVPTSLKKVTITGGIIGNNAFENCSSLTSVVIGDSVTSIGYDAFYGCSSLTEITLPFVGASKGGTSNTNFGYIFGASSSSYNNSYVPTSLKKVTITGGTSIGNYAFRDCSSLTSVVIGDSVTSIGTSAFLNCSGLTSVVIGDSVTSIGSYAFYNCSNLTSVVIPDSVTSIGDYAFYNCSSLTSVVIPDSVTSIGEKAFCDCYSLTSVVIGDGVTSIGKYAFRNCNSLTEITLPFVGASKNATGYKAVFGYIFGYTTSTSSSTISGATYQYCDSSSSSSYKYYHYYIPTSLKKVTITGGNIGSYAFYHCSKMTSVVIPDSVTSIGSFAFYDCDSLTSVVIPDSVTSIGSEAFEYCSSLTSVVIPDSVTSIGKSAFSGCSSLTSIEVSENNTAYKSIDGNLYSKDGKTFIQYARGKTDSEFIIPDSVTSIGYGAFRNCSSLTSIVIGDGVTSIGEFAFSGCSKMTSVVIGDSVESVGAYAFYGCSSLTSVVIPDSVTSIGNSAFYNCSSLSSITFEDTSTWYITTSTTNWQNKTGGTQQSLPSPSTNATYFKSTYYTSYWYKL